MGGRISPALSEQLRFAGLDGYDTNVGTRLWSIVSPEMDEILEQFYVRLKGFQKKSEFRRLDVKRLTRLQMRHWERLFRLDFSTDYEDAARRVGVVHSQVGLPPEWYVAGYMYFLERMTSVVRTACDPEEAGELTAILIKLVGIDIGVALSDYQLEGL